MPLVLQRSWVGRRVVVRRIVGSGADGRAQFGDVVGDLLALREDIAVIEASSGPVEVPLEHVALARLVQPAAADVLGLEQICARGWRPEEVAELDGWTLRANSGFTGRANSVLPTRQLRLGLDDALAQAREWYHERGLPLRLQIPLPARRLLDAALRELGFLTSTDVKVLAARLDALSSGRADAVEVRLAAEPDTHWLARYRDGVLPESARELLIRHHRVTFASIVRDGRPVAIARGVVDDGWLGVTAVEVEPQYRRLGLASAVMSRLWQWGADEHAARYSYLQVETTNTAALALYERLDYWQHHEYRYLTEPG
jgi:GNAT superfamily N-acetyltransferase